MALKQTIKRFDVYLVSLDPTRGSEIKKTRPCVVISPNEMNKNIRENRALPTARLPYLRIREG